VSEKTTEQNRGAVRLMTRVTAPFALSMCALSLGLTVLAFGLLVYLKLSHPSVPVYQYWAHAIAIAVAFSMVGVFIASRRPEHRIGWLFCAIGFLVAVDHFCGEYATYTLLANPDALPAGEAAAWIRSWIWIVSGGLGVFLLLLFPDGRLASRRWRYLAWLNVFVIVLGSILVAFSAGPIDAIPAIRNPLGIHALGMALDQRAADLVNTLQIAVALCATVSPLVRLRRAEPRESQQIKWFAYAALILIFGALLSALAPEVWDVWWDRWAGLALYIAGIVGLPVAVGIAIVRHHLYDIDLIINRTLVYGALTALLALVYFGGVALLQSIGSVILQLHFRVPLGQDKQLATVVATLAIAALFTPLRRKIQGFIDRRFYREKYDARKTVEAFSSRLGKSTDLDALSDDLVRAVRETMHPSHVSLWLRPNDSPQGIYKQDLLVRNSRLPE
jgi:hypothetical protein